jgi:hypothetical protein
VPPAQRHLGKYRGVVIRNDDPQRLGRLTARVPEVLGEVDSGWALPHVPYAGDGAGLHMIPGPDAGVWIEFEAGDPSRPIWTGCWWKGDQLPKDQGGSAATPAVKIVRSAQGMLLGIDDDGKTVVVSDSNGDNILKIEVSPGQITLKGASKAVVDAPAIELVQGAGHPVIYGDDLLQWLSQLVTTFNSHMHPGQMATAIGSPVTPMPPAVPAQPPTPALLSQKVKSG